MRILLASTYIVAGALVCGGCATKKYVRNTTAPIQAKVDQVGEQATRNTQAIDDTRNQVKQVDEKSQSGIAAAQARAGAADQHAADADQHAAGALSRANQAFDGGERNTQAIEKLRQVVANLDDFKLQTSVAVPFGFNRAKLTPEAQQDLDKVAASARAYKRFFLTIEGYTDSTGNREYNDALSRRRADAAVEYLVAKCDIPVYRVHTIGLGPEKPVDPEKSRAARAKNRRVEIKVFSADQAGSSPNLTTSLNGAGQADTSGIAPR